jgi:type II secretory pathway pseudopilin PulG
MPESRVWLQPANRSAGYTLVDMMLVVALIAIVAGMAVPVSAGLLKQIKADSSGLEALTWLQAARARATAERRNFEVTFDVSGNRIKIERVEPDLKRTPVLDQKLPDGMTFAKISGVPDTPDLFGHTSAVDLDGPGPYMFASDGSFVDANGDPSNGTIGMAKGTDPTSVRAITVFGVTGLTRRWRYSGKQWNQ